MPTIEAVGAREILDSRGNPTVEVEVALDDGTIARAAVPSGATTGAFEAVELRDGDAARYGGKGVTQAVDGVLDAIGRELLGLRGRPSSGSSTRRCSTSTAPPTRAASAPTRSSASRSPSRAPPPTRAGLPLFRYVGGPNAHVLPVPMLNILNGGAHADTNVDIQEFMIAPIGAPTLRRGAALGRRDLPRAEGGAEERGLATGVGDEGGFAPNLPSNRDALDLILEAIEQAGFTPAATSRSRSTSPPPSSTRTAATASRAAARAPTR